MSPSLQHKGIRLFFSVSTSPGLSCHCSQKSCLLFHQLFWEVDAKAASDVSCQRSSASPRFPHLLGQKKSKSNVSWVTRASPFLELGVSTSVSEGQDTANSEALCVIQPQLLLLPTC